MSEIKRMTILTAGAAGMYCGSCMHDNTLARALIRTGVETLLVPFYTPIRTDEQDVSSQQLFFGGINLYLRQRVPWLRYIPKPVGRLLDSPRLLRMLTRRASGTDPASLGELTLSMLDGADGVQADEVERVCRWLLEEARPDCIVLSNLLIGGCIPEIRRRLRVPVIVLLQGDDIFLDHLPDAYRTEAVTRLNRIASQVDGFVVNSEFYARRMGELLDLSRDRVHVLPLSIDATGFEPRGEALSAEVVRIGYLARLTEEKGLHRIVDAFLLAAQQLPQIELHIAGWLGESHRRWVESHFNRLREAGLGDRFRYHGSPNHEEKIEFLQQLDLLCVPTDYHDPKGLFVLEALATGVPVVQPAHGAFPELIASTGGGILVPPGDPEALAAELINLATNQARRKELGEKGRAAVMDRHLVDHTATELVALAATLRDRMAAGRPSDESVA